MCQPITDFDVVVLVFTLKTNLNVFYQLSTEEMFHYLLCSNDLHLIRKKKC